MNSFIPIIIACVARNNVIGKNGTIPWHCSEDLKMFSRLTSGSTLLVGNKTYKTLPKLKNRSVIVLSRNKLKFKDVPKLVKTPILWIAGGASIYEQTIPFAHLAIITRLHRDYNGDTYFPSFSSGWAYLDTFKMFRGGVVELWANCFAKEWPDV